MAASLSAATTGHLSAVAPSLSSSFLGQSKRIPSSFNPSTSTSSISGGGVSSSSAGRGGFGVGVRCRSAELEKPVTERSLYSLLGLEQNVDLNGIKTSYRKLARRYHPDVCSADEREECTKMFLQVQDAYEVLSDSERRAKYDYQLMNPLSPGAVGWGSVVRRRNDGDIDSTAWRSAWREQLAHFPMKEPKPDTWAAKMRAKNGHKHQESQ